MRSEYKLICTVQVKKWINKFQTKLENSINFLFVCKYGGAGSTEMGIFSPCFNLTREPLQGESCESNTRLTWRALCHAFRFCFQKCVELNLTSQFHFQIPAHILSLTLFSQHSECLFTSSTLLCHSATSHNATLWFLHGPEKEKLPEFLGKWAGWQGKSHSGGTAVILLMGPKPFGQASLDMIKNGEQTQP